MAFKLILGKLGEFAFSKVAEKTTDKAFADFNNIKDFELILKTLHDNLKLLSAKAADVEEEIKNAEVSGGRKRKREVKEWLEEVESIKQQVVELGSQVESGGFIRRLMDGGKATQLNEHIEKLVQQRLNFGELLLDVHGIRGEILLTNGMVGKAVNKDLEEVLKLLENRQVLSIGVYGMGGIGKTTLAKYIHNRLLKKSKGLVFWITVSQEFTIKSLQDKIARRLGVDLSNEDEEAIRAGRLNRFLSQMMNSVLILDDVWENIDMTRVGCTFSLEGCRLVITTRSLEVCHRIGCMKVIQLVKLCKEEAWKLFNETLGKDIQLGPQVEEIAKSMAKLCDGLPLGIITVAGSMKGHTTIHTWNNALAQLKSCVAEEQNDIGEVDEVFRVLKYSFDWLKRNDVHESNEPNMIQHCFLYCSLYPEDYEIRRDDLVGKFISGGLVDERNSRRAQVEQGLSILDKFVNVCLLESCVDNGGEECVKMHDLVRSMALRICKGKYMVRAGDYSLQVIPNEKEWTKDLEKVSFMKCGNLVSTIKGRISPNCPKLSTLLLWGNYQLEVIPNSFFSRMQGLCTLDLCKNKIRMLPNSLCDLKSLKSLLLEACCNLVKVPYLGKLKALRELNLSGTAIKGAPQGLEELLELRFLSIDAKGLKMLPTGLLLKLGHLQHLNLPPCIQVEVEEIMNLKQLEEFGGRLKGMSDFNWFITTRKVPDPWYKICVDSNSNRTFGSRVDLEYGTNPAFESREDVVNGIHELWLCKSNIRDEKVLGKSVACLTISKCKGLSKCFVDDLALRFDNPMSLKKLIISQCGGIEGILRSNCQFSNTLEVISVRGLHHLKEVVLQRGEIRAAPSVAQPAVFSSLKRIFIYECKKMRKVGLPVSALPNLETIHINRCGEIEEIFEEDEGRATSIVTTLPKLLNLNLWELPKLKKMGLPVSGVPNLNSIHINQCEKIEEIFKEDDEGRAASLPNLTWFILSDLPRLKSVNKTTISCDPHMSAIYIIKCPRLKNRLPLHFPDPTSRPCVVAGILVDREWWESLEWDTNINPNLPQLLQDYVRFESSS